VRDRRTRLGGGRRCWDKTYNRGPVHFATSVPSGPPGSHLRHPLQS
jgi:hypothetical protein